ncbi:MAG: cusS [Myxococcales bacterium]|nr:cusS [Myxococcales bacterium]
MTSLRARLTAVVVALVAVVLLVLAMLLYIGVRRASWQQHDAAIAARARATAEIAEHDDGGYEMDLPPEPHDVPRSYVEVWRADGSVLVRSSSLHDDLPHPSPGLGQLAYTDLTLPDGRDGRAVTMRFLARDEAKVIKGEPLVMIVADGTEDVDAATGTVRTWFIVLGIGALLAIAFVTAWSLARGLRPLAALATEIERIDDRRLSTRLSVDGQPTELVVPVRKLNDLFARLDASFARERQFTADVSHELRTPLAGLRTLLEVTALADRSTSEYQAAMSDALVIVLQLGTLVENLLALARLDAGQIEEAGDLEASITGREFSLRALVEECWKPHAAAAAARSLEFRNAVPADALASTDRERLRIVIANLLSNAAEYTNPGGWIEVASGKDAILDVTDSGPPIAADQLERIFDRLWRGDTARSATGVHCGIGLALARSLCTSLSLSLSAATLADGSVRFRIATAPRSESPRRIAKGKPSHDDRAISA